MEPPRLPDDGDALPNGFSDNRDLVSSPAKLRRSQANRLDVERQIPQDRDQSCTPNPRDPTKPVRNDEEIVIAVGSVVAADTATEQDDDLWMKLPLEPP